MQISYIIHFKFFFSNKYYNEVIMKTYKTLLLSFMVILFAFVGCDTGNSSNPSSERCIVMYDNEEIPCDFHEVETAVDFLEFLELKEGTDFIIEGNTIKLLNEVAYKIVKDYLKI